MQNREKAGLHGETFPRDPKADQGRHRRHMERVHARQRLVRRSRHPILPDDRKTDPKTLGLLARGQTPAQKSHQARRQEVPRFGIHSLLCGRHQVRWSEKQHLAVPLEGLRDHQAFQWNHHAGFLDVPGFGKLWRTESASSRLALERAARTGRTI